jgi:hypothetical protein
MINQKMIKYSDGICSWILFSNIRGIQLSHDDISLLIGKRANIHSEKCAEQKREKIIGIYPSTK